MENQPPPAPPPPPPPPAVPPPPQPRRLTAERLTLLVEDSEALAPLPLFDIRNGESNTARNVFIRASIPDAYHWVPVAGIAPGSPLHRTFLGAYIRSAWAQMSGPRRPAGMNDQTARKGAIALGVIRGLSTHYYRIDAQGVDVIPGERTSAIYTYIPGVPAAPPAVAIPPSLGYIPIEAPAAGPARIAAAEAAAAPGGAEAPPPPEIPPPTRGDLAEEFEALTPLEMEVTKVLARITIAVLPGQGYGLSTDDHHYLSAPRSSSYRFWDAIWRQVVLTCGMEVREWFAADTEALKDFICHKSGHPIMPELKMSLAADPRVRDFLTAANLGSAAPRLPVRPSIIRTASTYKALAANVNPTWRQVGGSVTTTTLNALLAYATQVEDVKVAAALGRLPAGTTEAGALAAIPVPQLLQQLPQPATPGNIQSLLATYVESIGSAMTIAYGFYVASMEGATAAAGAGGVGAVSATLRDAYSLRKLPGQFGSSYLEGTAAYRDYMEWRREQRKKGKFTFPTLTL